MPVCVCNTLSTNFSICIAVQLSKKQTDTRLKCQRKKKNNILAEVYIQTILYIHAVDYGNEVGLPMALAGMMMMMMMRCKSKSHYTSL